MKTILAGFLALAFLATASATWAFTPVPSALGPDRSSAPIVLVMHCSSAEKSYCRKCVETKPDRFAHEDKSLLKNGKETLTSWCGRIVAKGAVEACHQDSKADSLSGRFLLTCGPRYAACLRTIGC